MVQLSPSDREELRDSLARYGYRLGEAIGEGGMGTIYRGEQVALHRPVAIKTVKPSRTSSHGAPQRFNQEVQILAQLYHPGIVPIYASSQDDDPVPFFVMPYVPGSDLGQQLEEARAASSPFSVTETCQRLHQVAAALDYVHNRGVVHRDIKPANILINTRSAPAESAYLTDFGVSLDLHTDRVTLEGLTIGTLDYLAPELCACGEFEHESAPTPHRRVTAIPSPS